MTKLQLPNICLCICDCYNYGAAVASIKRSMEQCDFGSVKFLTDIPIKVDGVEVIQIAPINSKEGYSDFIIRELYKYIDKEYVLIQQHDSWVLDINAWEDSFLDYDVIGASWLYIDGRNNSNGGFSLRTKRLMEVVAKDENIKITHPEDEVIGRLYRHYLEDTHGIVFPTDDVCDRFSFELRTPVQSTFGFHSYFHKPYQPTVVVRRQAALGDVVQVEPVLQYFHDKGYRVVLDTLPQFHLLFINHYFKVHRLQEVDQRVLDTAKYVNLDGSYEAEPDLNHLIAYFKYAGIEEPKEYLKRPTLSLGFPLTHETKIFKRLAVIHYDRRGQEGRNIQGINWEYIVSVLIIKGYTVLQIGKGEHEKIKGAHEINITNENFLCYVLGSADIFIGCDSGPSNIAVAFGVPSIIFFGMVESSIIHYDLSNIFVIDNGDCCELPKCWHKSGVGATAGMKCIVDESKPPCVQFQTSEVVSAINKIHDSKL